MLHCIGWTPTGYVTYRSAKGLTRPSGVMSIRLSAHGCCLGSFRPRTLETEEAALFCRSWVMLSMLPEGVVLADVPSPPYCPFPGASSVGLLGILCSHKKSMLQGLFARAYAASSHSTGYAQSA